MAGFNDMFSRAAQNMRGLTMSQRIAIVLSGLVVVASVAWLANWAATPEMVPLLDQKLQPEELALVRNGLELMGQEYRITGSQVLVRPSANRSAILAQLQQSEKLPASTSAGFDAMVKESNPWLSQEENDRRWTVALKHEVEKVLRLFAGVKHAEVFLNLNSRPRGFSRHEAQGSASVTLIMQNGESVSRTLAVAAAKLVSGAVRGLPLQNVNVVDGNGNSAIDWEEESNGGASGQALQRMQRDYEKRIAEKIRTQLAFDPRVRVNVQVNLEMSSKEMKSSTPSDPIPIDEETDSSERIRASRAAQPGVEPNTAMAVGGGSGDQRETRETRRTKSIPAEKVESSVTPSGAVKEAFAAINVSYSYLAGVVKRQNPAATTEPAEADILKAFDAEKKRIVSQVSMLVKPQTEEQVRVDWYYDAVAAGDGAAATDTTSAPASTMDTTMSLVKTYGPTTGLALLALFSFALMFNMARKSNTDAIGLDLTAPGGGRSRRSSRRSGGNSGDGDSDLLSVEAVGDTLVTDGVLVGREVDEKTVQINTMLEQVSNVVSKDPQGVASLMERWIHNEK